MIEGGDHARRRSRRRRPLAPPTRHVDDDHTAPRSNEPTQYAAVEVGVEQDVAPGSPRSRRTTRPPVAGVAAGHHERPATDVICFVAPSKSGPSTQLKTISSALSGFHPAAIGHWYNGGGRTAPPSVGENQSSRIAPSSAVVEEPLGEVGTGALHEPPGADRDADRPVLGPASLLDVDLLAVGVLDDDRPVRVFVLRLGRVSCSWSMITAAGRSPTAPPADSDRPRHRARQAGSPPPGTRYTSASPRRSSPRPTPCRHSCARWRPMPSPAVPSRALDASLARTTATSPPSGTTSVRPVRHGGAQGGQRPRRPLATDGDRQRRRYRDTAPITAIRLLVPAESAAAPPGILTVP